jgi:hypothetical protein
VIFKARPQTSWITFQVWSAGSRGCCSPDWDAVSGAPSIRRIQAARGAVTGELGQGVAHDRPSIRRIQAARGAVKVGSFPSNDTHVMIVTMSSGQRLRLLVVPADTEPGLASRAMQQAADDRNTEGPSTLLGLSGPDQSGTAHAAWNDHAGSPT